jgi:hypothetical protein
MKLNFPVTELKSDTFFIQPDSSVIDLSTDEIAEESGYERGNAPDYFRDIIAESITKCKSISRPACGYRILSINKEETSPECIAICDIRLIVKRLYTVLRTQIRLLFSRALSVRKWKRTRADALQKAMR